MAVVNPPGFLQNAGATHTAEQMRSWFSVFSAGKVSLSSLITRGGVKVDTASSLVVTQTGSPSMAVIVTPGLAVIPGTEGSKQGVYLVENDANVTLSITAAHATLNRIDSVVFKVQDTAYSGAVNSSSLVVVDGTPASSPSPPTLPANSIELARVSVVALDTSITNGEITDRRPFLAAAGGTIICFSTNRPAANTMYNGQEIYELDTNRSLVTHDAGATWENRPRFYIARQTLGGTTASVTFSSIPTNLRSLTIRYRARANAGGVNVNMTINGNAGAVYSVYTAGSNNAGDITPAGATGSTSAFVGVIPGGGTRFGSAQIIIPAWDITTLLQWQYTSFAYDGVDLYARYGGGTYDVAGPYTSFTLAPAAGSFIAGSDFQIEGMYN